MSVSATLTLAPGCSSSQFRPALAVFRLLSRTVAARPICGAQVPADYPPIWLGSASGCSPVAAGADWDTLCVETAGVVSMAGVCHRSGRAQDDLEPRRLLAARCAVAVAGILLDDLRRLGMEAGPR